MQPGGGGLERWIRVSAAPLTGVLATGLFLLASHSGNAAPVAARGKVFEPVRRVASPSGEDLFFHETFQGNGRTCSTCHDPRTEYTVSPELVRERFKLDPTHPLFRPIDSDDGLGHGYTRLFQHAAFRVNVPLHENVSIVGDPTRRSIPVFRGVPSISNLALTAPYLQEGRAETLQDQALGAILDHLEPSRSVLASELDAIAAFEKQLFYPLRLRSLLDVADPLPKEPGFTVPIATVSARKGKEVFDLICRTCHDGETGHEPQSDDIRPFASVFVSERNLPGFPVFALAFRQPDGTEMIAYTPDPGRAAITGDLLDLNAFDIPPLRGLKHTAPYFHDNSAATLQELIDLYDEHFQFHLTPDQKKNLVAYLELL
jgi:cytochrome c peroxidase